MAYDYDLFVIGAGSGGVRAARLAAMAGKRVAVAESDRVGGTCVIRGCVPKKFMVYASEFSHGFEDARGFGWTVEVPVFDWTKFLARKDDEIARLSGIYTTNLNKAGADLIHGFAAFTDPHTLKVSGPDGSKEVTAEQVLIATGGHVHRPDIDGIEHAITSDEAFHLKALPKSILIAGGYIAVEFAGIFAGLGVETTLAYRGDNILRGFDDDVRVHLAGEMEKRGIRIILGAAHRKIEKTESGLISHFGDSHPPCPTEVVMFATGRRASTGGLNLKAAGVAENPDGTVTVDKFSKTNVQHIWAIGDVTGRLNLTPVAIREAVAFVDTAFHGKPHAFDHELVPTAVFSQPPVGTVGLSEAAARHLYGQVDIYRARFRPMKTTFTGGRDQTLMKLVVDAKSQCVVGVHIAGVDAPEMIQLAAIAVKMGVTKAQWDDTCALHPTAAEELVTMREKYVPNEVAG